MGLAPCVSTTAGVPPGLQGAPLRTSSTTTPFGGASAGALAAGALLGAGDALLVSAADTVVPAWPAQAALLVADALLLALVALAGALPAALLLRRWAAKSPQWWGFMAGLATVSLADLAESWFTRPPPFTAAPPLHGNPVAFGALALAVVGLAVVLAARVRGTRLRVALVLAVSVVLALRITTGTRRLSPGGAPASDAPNVLLVTIDTVRADHVGVKGVQTPSFDALAREGARFDTAISQIPVTGPSHTTILSGLAPWDHGNLLNGVPVPVEVPLLSQTLRAAGYRTGAFVSAYVLDGTIGLTRGFEVYDDDFGVLQGWSETLPGRLVAAVKRHLSPDEVLERRGDRTVDAALAWLEGQAAGPWFAWVHVFDPHGPYEPPPPWDTAYYGGDPRDPAHTSLLEATGIAEYMLPSLEGITDAQWVRAQYSGEISYADQQLGRLLAWLDERGLDAGTLVVVAGDHGESLGEHGVWFNHGGDLFDPATRVPLAITWPGHVPAGTRVSDPVELTDLAPTIYELLGLPVPERVTGRSMVSAIFGARGRPFARSMCFDREANIRGRERGELSQPVYRTVALRSAGSRYVYREAADFGEAYYDLARDPDETAPAEVSEELVGTLRGIAQDLLAGMGQDGVKRSGTDLDPDTRKRLEALGYLEGE